MKIIFLIASLLAFSSQIYSQHQQKLIDSIVNSTKVDFPDVGIVIGISTDLGTNFYSYGSQQIDGTKKLDSTSIFEIGSATKTFTSLLLAQNIQNGNLEHQGFIDEFLPQDISLNCQLKNRIKLTDLASHQSGLPNLSNDKYFSQLLQLDPNNPFRFVDEKYLYNVLRETDSLKDYRKYQYNNYAYSLLGDILANYKGRKYSELIKESILDPLGMSSTTMEIPTSSNVAGLYNQDGDPQEYLITDAVNPAGGLKSNAVDLMKYLKAHIYNREMAFAVKLTQLTYYEDYNKKIGLGWEIGKDHFQKDGDTFGNSCLIRYSPENKLAIVVLSNHQNGQLVRDLMNGIYDKL